MEKKRRSTSVENLDIESGMLPEMRAPPYWSYYSKPRLFVHKVISSKYFDLAIAGVIGLNVITMALEYYMMPPELQFALKIFNYFFTSVFILEAIVKMVALGAFRYMKDSKWNQLDMAIVILSVIGIVLEELKTGVIPINPTIIRVMRVLRIARVLKLLKMAKGIRALLDTVMQALPQVGNLGLLFFLLFFIFAALGVELFGRLECSDKHQCEGLSKHAHFQNFGMAFLTLFRVATGDNWNGIMKDTLREDCDKSDDCVRNCCVSPIIAPVFFVVFVLMAQFVLVNVVVAVLMKHLEDSKEQAVEDALMELEIEQQLEREAHNNITQKNTELNKHVDEELAEVDVRRETKTDDHRVDVEKAEPARQPSSPPQVLSASIASNSLQPTNKYNLTKQASLPPNFTFNPSSPDGNKTADDRCTDMELSCPPNNLLSTTIPQIKFAPPTPEPPVRSDFNTPGSLTSTDSDAPFKWSSVPDLGSPPRWRPSSIHGSIDNVPQSQSLVAPSNGASNSSASQISDEYYSCVPEEEEEEEEFVAGWEDTECDEEIKRITGGRSQAPSPEPTFVPSTDDVAQLALLPTPHTNPEHNIPKEHDSSQQALLPVAVLRISSPDVTEQQTLLLSKQSGAEDDDPPCDGDQFV